MGVVKTWIFGKLGVSNVWSDLIITFLLEWSIWVYGCLMTRKGSSFSEPIDAMVLFYINLFKFKEAYYLLILHFYEVLLNLFIPMTQIFFPVYP